MLKSKYSNFLLLTAMIHKNPFAALGLLFYQATLEITHVIIIVFRSNHVGILRSRSVIKGFSGINEVKNLLPLKSMAVDDKLPLKQVGCF